MAKLKEEKFNYIEIKSNLIKTIFLTRLSQKYFNLNKKNLS